MTTSDTAALFSRRPLPVTVAGVTVMLPWRPAAEWVSHLDHLHVLAARLADPEGRDALARAVTNKTGAAKELKAESLRILGEVTGRKWWESGRLLASSADTEILGRLVLSGVDPWQRSAGEWAAAVYALCLKDQDQKGRDKFTFTLSLPPPGYEEEWDDGLPDLDDLEAQYARALGK